MASQLPTHPSHSRNPCCRRALGPDPRLIALKSLHEVSKVGESVWLGSAKRQGGCLRPPCRASRRIALNGRGFFALDKAISSLSELESAVRSTNPVSHRKGGGLDMKEVTVYHRHLHLYLCGGASVNLDHRTCLTRGPPRRRLCLG